MTSFRFKYRKICCGFNVTPPFVLQNESYINLGLWYDPAIEFPSSPLAPSIFHQKDPFFSLASFLKSPCKTASLSQRNAQKMISPILQQQHPRHTFKTMIVGPHWFSWPLVLRSIAALAAVADSHHRARGRQTHPARPDFHSCLPSRSTIPLGLRDY